MILGVIFLGLVANSVLAGYNLAVKPAAYVTDVLDERPVVSLCESKGVVIRSSTLLDICLTITPTQENEKPKSFLCSNLIFKPRNVGSMYSIEEAGDSCMIKMRSFANSKGIAVNSPIDFTYTLDKDPSGTHDTVGTVAVHLKWAQQDTPINQLSGEGLGTTKSTKTVALTITTAVILWAVLAL